MASAADPGPRPAGTRTTPGCVCRVRRTYRGRMGHSVSASRPDGNQYPVSLSDEEWAQRLSPNELAVLRGGGTERAFTGEYTDTKTTGVYSCRACGAELFRSDSKFDSHCGWPSFFTPLAGDSVDRDQGPLAGDVRTEVRCANCGSHLGHVFAGEGYGHPDRPALLHQLDQPEAGARGELIASRTGHSASSASTSSRLIRARCRTGSPRARAAGPRSRAGGASGPRSGAAPRPRTRAATRSRRARTRRPCWRARPRTHDPSARAPRAARDAPTPAAGTTRRSGRTGTRTATGRRAHRRGRPARAPG